MAADPHTIFDRARAALPAPELPDLPKPALALDRRAFLALTGQGIGLSALLTLPGCGGGSGGGGSNPPMTGVPPASVELQTLKRTSFGVTPDELTGIQASGVNAYIAQQLDYESIDTTVLEDEITARYPLSTQTAAELRDGFPENFGEIVEDLVGATLLRAYASPRQLYEVMVEFWSNHFSIHLINGIIPLLKPTDDRDVIRPNALGSFSDLLHASAKSPAMLYYLDNYLNFAGEPQENYARELLELHTVGDGNFTENDVKEVARCFTGWTININTGLFTFVPFLHDDDSKTVLGEFIPAGGGITDGERVLDILAASPDTAQFVATKLCRRFISDTPDPAVISDVADAFTQSDGDIVTTLQALFASAAFTDSVDQKLTRPMEFVGQLVRGLRTDANSPDDDTIRIAFAVLNLLGQVPFYWVPPNGYPDVTGYWGSTSGFLNRWRIALALNDAGVQALLPVAWLSGNADTLAELVDAIAMNLLQRELGEADRQLVLDWLVDQLGVAENDELPQATIDVITPFVAGLLASSAYYQLR